MSLRFLIGKATRGPSFDSGAYSGLQLDLDANVVSSITKDGSDKVSQWNDLSGNDNHATQATGANQFTWNATGFNSSYGTMVSTGSPLKMDLTSAITGSSMTIFIVSEITAGGSDANRCHFLGSTTDANVYYELGSGASTYWQVASTNGSTYAYSNSPGGVALNTPYLLVTNSKTTPATAQYGYNGISMTTFFGNAGASWNFTYNEIGHWNTGGSYYMKAKLTRLLIYSPSLSDGDIASIRNDLALAYGMSP